MKIIDSHTHLMTKPFQYLQGLPVNEFVDLMDEAEISVSVIFTLIGLIRDFRAHNDELAEVVATYPDRLVGLGSVNPWYGDEAVEEVRRCFTELGFAGLKLHPWFTGILHPWTLSVKSQPSLTSQYSYILVLHPVLHLCK
jgi:predicted TIM-barrel fold metal-dependent hydrolase